MSSVTGGCSPVELYVPSLKYLRRDEAALGRGSDAPELWIYGSWSELTGGVEGVCCLPAEQPGRVQRMQGLKHRFQGNVNTIFGWAHRHAVIKTGSRGRSGTGSA